MSYILTINIDPAGMGGVAVNPSGTYYGPGQREYEAGTVVTLTATFYGTVGQFDHWEGNLSGSANPTQITMNGNKTVTAVFVVGGQTYALSTSVIGSGSIAPSEGIYNPDDVIILVASPASGQQFVEWSGDISGCTPVPSMPNHLQVPMDRNRHIMAEFEEAPEPDFSNLSVAYAKV